jgi:AraC-like DNA-binding protein
MPAIERIWMGDSDVDPAIGHRSEPVLGADVVFTFAEGTWRVALQGPLTTRRVYPHRAGAEYVGIRFRAGAGASFARGALASLSDDAGPVRAVGGLDLVLLGDALAEQGDSEAKGRFALHVVRRHEHTFCGPSPLVREAFRLLRTTRPMPKLAVIASALGTTQRTLERAFEREVGLRPKQAARLLRVEHILAAAARRPRLDLAKLALETGFADQSHMTNEVRRVLGTTPKRLFAEYAGSEQPEQAIQVRNPS